jgi:hypothetical protein
VIEAGVRLKLERVREKRFEVEATPVSMPGEYQSINNYQDGVSTEKEKRRDAQTT